MRLLAYLLAIVSTAVILLVLGWFFGRVRSAA
jgi:hypothetical protein